MSNNLKTGVHLLTAFGLLMLFPALSTELSRYCLNDIHNSVAVLRGGPSHE